MAQTKPQSVWVEHQKNISYDRLLGIIRPQQKFNEWFLMGVLGVSRIEIHPSTDSDKRRFVCIDRNSRVIATLDLPSDMGLREKVTVLRTAIRMATHGYDI
jgi:hypothetical protein